MLKLLTYIVSFAIGILVMIGIHILASLYYGKMDIGADCITAILAIPVGVTIARLVYVFCINVINKVQNKHIHGKEINQNKEE